MRAVIQPHRQLTAFGLFPERSPYQSAHGGRMGVLRDALIIDKWELVAEKGARLRVCIISDTWKFNEADQEATLRQLRDASNGLHEPE